MIRRLFHTYLARKLDRWFLKRIHFCLMPFPYRASQMRCILVFPEDKTEWHVDFSKPYGERIQVMVSRSGE